MLAVQQQKSLCRRFVEVSAARRGCHTMVLLTSHMFPIQVLAGGVRLDFSDTLEQIN